METFIPEQDIMARIKRSNHLSEEDIVDVNFNISKLYMTTKTKIKLNSKIKNTNQDRSKYLKK
jgi:hypothetical protein